MANGLSRSLRGSRRSGVSSIVVWAASLSLYPVVMDCGNGMLAPRKRTVSLLCALACALSLIRLTHASVRSFYQASSNRHRRAPKLERRHYESRGRDRFLSDSYLFFLTLGLIASVLPLGPHDEVQTKTRLSVTRETDTKCGS